MRTIRRGGRHDELLCIKAYSVGVGTVIPIQLNAMLTHDPSNDKAITRCRSALLDLFDTEGFSIQSDCRYECYGRYQQCHL